MFIVMSLYPLASTGMGRTPVSVSLKLLDSPCHVYLLRKIRAKDQQKYTGAMKVYYLKNISITFEINLKTGVDSYLFYVPFIIVDPVMLTCGLGCNQTIVYPQEEHISMTVQILDEFWLLRYSPSHTTESSVISITNNLLGLLLWFTLKGLRCFL